MEVNCFDVLPVEKIQLSGRSVRTKGDRNNNRSAKTHMVK